MAFRFRRRVTIFPGVRINVSKRSVSLSAGIRGASITAGKQGVHGNVGAPGTGLSYRSRLDKKGQRQRAGYPHQSDRPKVQLSLKLSLDERGHLLIEDQHGEPLNARLKRQLWNDKADGVRAFLQKEMDAINGDMDLILNIHEDTPPADEAPPQYEPEPFDIAEPERPELPVLPIRPVVPKKRIWHRLFRSLEQKRLREAALQDETWEHTFRRASEERVSIEQDYQQRLAIWKDALKDHEEKQSVLASAFDESLKTDPAFMEDILEAELQQLDWPRETHIDFIIQPEQKRVLLDVDLPAPGELPTKEARFSANKKRLLIKDKSDRQQREEYAQHIHGIVMRLVGVTFVTLPAIETVGVSAYTQRLNTATGHENDDYLLAIEVTRDRWAELNFEALDRVDPIEALNHFQLERNMTKTGIFKPVDPIREEQ